MPQDVLAALVPLAPEERLRLPREEDRLEANSSGELNGEDIAANKVSRLIMVGVGLIF